jgi:predicted secreted protein
VVLVSHCLLNENTRYLGGACRPGCVAEVVEACVTAGFGIVQMPCPEEQVWGGVLKRHLLRTYGSPVLRSGRLRRTALPVALAYTRWRYRRLARAVAAQAADYQRSGLDMAAVLGVDGSPSCGLEQTLDTARVLDGLVHVDPDTVAAAEVNAIVRGEVSAGSGMYTRALQRQLRRARPAGTVPGSRPDRRTQRPARGPVGHRDHAAESMPASVQVSDATRTAKLPSRASKWRQHPDSHPAPAARVARGNHAMTRCRCGGHRGRLMA